MWFFSTTNITNHDLENIAMKNLLIITVQELLLTDYRKRVEFCNWYMNAKGTIFSHQGYYEQTKQLLQDRAHNNPHSTDKETFNMNFGVIPVRNWLDENYGHRSPDLTPLYFYLWETLKDKVYRTEMTSRRINNSVTEMKRNS
ncbi:LOW QUALITY PROTEIN: hypothetical protein V1478_005713 [Vespula squamosa]|uniref:Uncharacterized protein n=1 Tax=Vespula squamosa TaxID=30214 RepID=A0ABD2BA37_VESSQ